MDAKPVLLMTATVDPRGCPGAWFSPEERERQYADAFRYNLTVLGEREGLLAGLVFAENSGWDLSAFARMVPPSLRERVELLSFDANEFDPLLGKGTNEENLIDRTLDRSRLIGRAGFFFKVTGRYPILTLRSHLRQMRRQSLGLDLICDVKRNWCDTRAIGFAVSFYRRNVYGRGNELTAAIGRPFESQMFDLCVKNRDNPRCVFRFALSVLNGGHEGRRHLRLFGVPIPRACEKIVSCLVWAAKNAVSVFRPRFSLRVNRDDVWGDGPQERKS